MPKALPFNPAHRDFTWGLDDVARALAVFEPVHRIATQIPAKAPGSAGKPRAHPEVLYAMYMGMIGVSTSARQVAGWFRKPHNWQWLRETWAREFGIELDPNPPCRITCRNGLVRARAYIPEISAEFRATAMEQAHEQGLLNGPHTMVDPPRANVVVADGTVPKVRFKTSTYDELLKAPELKANGDRRSLPDARVHTEGGKNTVIGEKFVIMSARADKTANTRVILDVRHCPSTSPAGEAKVAVNALLELRKTAPGMHGVFYDGALRSVNIDPLVKAGLNVVSPPNKGIPSRFIRTITCTTCGDEHRFGSHAGW
ncbi:MAG: hypothetical protein ACYCTH_14900, partial [Cellulomonas sp.]